MIAALRRLSPSFFAQVFGLLVLSLVAAQAVNMAIIYFLPPPPPEFFRASEVAKALRAAGGPVTTGAGRILKAHITPDFRLVGEPRAQRFTGRLREELALQLRVPDSKVRLTLLDNQRGPFRRFAGPFPGQPAEPPPGRPPGPKRFPAEGSNERFIVSPFAAALELPDGRWSNVVERDQGLFSTWQRRVLLWFGLCALALAPLAYLFARGLAAPVSAFANGAERLGRDPGAPHLQIDGPAEVRTAVAAFNKMQDRLNRYVQDRTATVGAIAHDLRTPLTRLRFRVESLPESARGRMSADIDEMEQMIAATLAFVRDDSQPAARSRLELGSLVGTVADEMSDTGHDVVAASAGGPVIVEGDPLALRRLTANLLDNAVKFGSRARVRVSAAEGSAVIEVEDDGPGVAAADMEKVFEPFRRIEPSRSRETGGAGLGLAVVRSVARAHGGDAALENLVGGGLLARVWLPLAPVSR